MKSKMLNEFTQFEIEGLKIINGGIMRAEATCVLTECNPCPDDPCHDCCSDERGDD